MVTMLKEVDGAVIGSLAHGPIAAGAFAVVASGRSHVWRRNDPGTPRTTRAGAI